MNTSARRSDKVVLETNVHFLNHAENWSDKRLSKNDSSFPAYTEF